MADIDALSIRISASTKVATRNINNLVTALQNLSTALNNINPSGLNNVTSAATNVTNAMSRASESTRTVAQNITNLGQQAGNMAQVGDAAQNIAEQMSQAGHGVREAGEALGEGASGAREVGGACQEASNAVETLRNVFSGLLGNIRTIGSVFKSVAQGALSAAKHIKNFGKSSRSSKSNVSGLVKEITRLGKMLKLMITRMVLRKIISGVLDGFKNLAQYSKTFDATLSLLWNDFRQLGNSIAAAVSPLLNALAPAIHYIIQLVIQAVDAINQLISAIMGLGSFTRAKKLTDSYAGSLNSANKSAKELKKTLLGFDELNQLQDNKSSGGGGTSPADMFEEATISDKWKDWADKLKKMWEDADFTELGRILGEKLLNALENIPWDKIKNAARKLGKSLATLINGFIEVENLGYTIGKTLSEAINTAFEFLDSFVSNFHWRSAGKFIGETINGWFENIDWELIQHTFETGFTGLGNAIAQFVTTFRWDNLSDFVGNLVNTLTGSIKALFSAKLYDDRGFQLNYSPLYKIGYEIGYQISRSIQEIDWKQFGQALGAAIQGLIDGLKGIIDGLKEKGWQPVKEALEQGFEGMAETLDFTDVAKIIAGLLLGAISLQVAKAAFADIGASIVAMISGGAAAAGGATAAMGEAASAAGEAAAAMGEVAEATGEATGAISGLNAVAGGGATVMFFDTISHFNKQRELGKLYDDFTAGKISSEEFEKAVSELHKKGINVLSESIDKYVEKSTAFKDSTTLSTKELEEYMKQAGYSKEAIDEAARSTENAAKKSKESAGYFSFVGDVIKKVKEYFSSFGDTSKVVWDEVPTEVANAQVTMSGSLNEISLETKKMSEDVVNSTDSVKKSFDEKQWTFSGVADGLIKTFEAAKKGIAPIWNSMVDKLNGEHRIGFSSFSINLPRFAAGGFPKTGTMFLANEAGAEMVGSMNGRTAVANNQEITEGIAMAVYNAMTMAQSGGGQYINNTIMVDGDVIARVVTKGQEKMNRRYSPTMA